MSFQERDIATAEKYFADAARLRLRGLAERCRAKYFR